MNPIYVTKPFLPPLDEYHKLLERIWDSGQLTNNGQLYQELEQRLKSRFGWENASLFTNGHLALETALRSLELKTGGEIITTPFTFVSTVAAIVNQGFTPVFCDIDDCFTIDAKQIESLITEKTVAILPVHVYGFPCDVERIAKIANKHHLKVVYDAAHAIGVRVNGKDIASYGDISMFSFHATKLFHTIEGGALAYSDDKLRKSIELHKNFGISGPETIDLVGTNAKMNEFQAAMGLLLLQYLDELVAKRKEIYERYMQYLKDLPGIRLTTVNDSVIFNYAYMPVLFEDGRDRIFDYLGKHNIFARKYFFPSISKVDCYKKYLRGNSLKNAEETSEKVITLPIYPSLNMSQVDYICDTVKRAL